MGNDMKRLTEQIKNKETGEILAYRLYTEVDRIRAYRKLGEYEDAEEQGLLIKRNKDDEVYLRVIACEVMEHQKNYSEDVYHMFSKGVQAFLVAIEKALAEMEG
jgi:hypothetical protein